MHLVLQPNPTAPGIARDHLDALRGSLGPRHDEIVLVVSELVANSVRHSSCTTPITLDIEVSERTVRVEVTDCGDGFDPEQGLSGDGLGLVIVSRVAESWGVRGDGPCTVWAEIPMVAATGREAEPAPVATVAGG